jgi:serine/threonine protein kinase
VQVLRRVKGHSNIVQYMDSFKDEGRLCIVMEYVAGESLAAYLAVLTVRASCGGHWVMSRAQAPLPPQVVLQFNMQLATGLHHLHLHKICHRDMKPANILLDTSLQVCRDGMHRWSPRGAHVTGLQYLKICDFGLASLATSRLSISAGFKGSPTYMAPELYGSQPKTFKMDVWSLGCILYEMAYLTRAFDANDFVELGGMITRCEHQPFTDAVR